MKKSEKLANSNPAKDPNPPQQDILEDTDHTIDLMDHPELFSHGYDFYVSINQADIQATEES